MEPILEQLAESVSNARTLEELARPMLEMLEAVTGLESTYLTSIDFENNFQHILYARNTKQLQIPEGLSVAWDDTLCKRALDEGRMYTDDVGTCWADSEAARALGIATYVSTPVRTGRGVLYGTLCAASASRASLPADAERILGMFSKMIGQHIERENLLSELKAAYAAMEEAALSDPLTGLANRRRLFEEMARMLAATRRSGQALIVTFVDLDGFKEVNDRHGHAAGDSLLVAYAKRILADSRAEDLVARYGGDEFVVVAVAPWDHADHVASLLADRLRNAVALDFDLGQSTIRCKGASVGSFVADPCVTTVEAILAEADARMYDAKRAGGSGRPGA